MQLDILTPEKKLYSGEASSVKLPGVAGNFQILDNHAPIIAALEEGEVVYATAQGETKLAIKDGFVECLNNKVVVLVGGGEIVA